MECTICAYKEYLSCLCSECAENLCYGVCGSICLEPIVIPAQCCKCGEEVPDALN